MKQITIEMNEAKLTKQNRKLLRGITTIVYIYFVE